MTLTTTPTGRDGALALALAALGLLLGGCFASADSLNDEGARLVDRERDWAGGQALFEKALAKDDRNAPAHKNLALCLMKTGKVDEARTHLEQAVAIDPTYAEALINLSLVCYQQKDYAAAVEHMDRAVDNGFPVDMRYRETLDAHR